MEAAPDLSALPCPAVCPALVQSPSASTPGPALSPLSLRCPPPFSPPLPSAFPAVSESGPPREATRVLGFSLRGLLCIFPEVIGVTPSSFP